MLLVIIVLWCMEYLHFSFIFIIELRVVTIAFLTSSQFGEFWIHVTSDCKHAWRQQCRESIAFLVLDLRDHTVDFRLRFKPPDDSLSRDGIAIVVALSHPPSPSLWHYRTSRSAALGRTLDTSVQNPRGPLKADIESRKPHPHFVQAACRKHSAYPCSISALKLSVGIINHLRICVRACSIVGQSVSHSLRRNSRISERYNFQSTSAETRLIFFWRWRPS